MKNWMRRAYANFFAWARGTFVFQPEDPFVVRVICIVLVPLVLVAAGGYFGGRRLLRLRGYVRAWRLLWETLDPNQRRMLLTRGYFLTEGKSGRTFLIHSHGLVEGYTGRDDRGRGHWWQVYCSHPSPKANLPGPDIAVAQKLLLAMGDQKWQYECAHPGYERLRKIGGKPAPPRPREDLPSYTFNWVYR